MVIDEKRNRKNLLKSKGFYMVLALCLVAAGTGVWGAMRSAQNPAGVTPSVTQQQVIDWENQGGRDLEDTPQANVPATQVPDPRDDETAAAGNTTAAKTTTQAENNTPYTGEYLLPMGTDILKDYSYGEMVQSKTMGDWRVHNGVDFRGQAGTDVLAIQDGTVAKTYNDALWGQVVEIDHGNGLLAKYCGMQKDSAAKEGTKVRQGQMIGKLGVVPVESLDDPHLHLEISVHEEIVDPLEAMNKVGDGSDLQ